MNIDKLNNTTPDAKSITDPVKAHKKQLQEQGLKQAVQFSQQETTISMTAAQNRVSYKVVSQSMSENLVIDGQRPGKPDPLPEKTSGFDFEKVAKNVMGFVGGVIRGAASAGAPDDKLQTLFGQARDGVARGISQARQDLGDWLNDDISQGIDKSESLIGEQMGALEQEILNVNPLAGGQVSELAYSQQQQRNSSLVIRTREGDEVNIRFTDLQRASVEQLEYRQNVRSDAGEAASTMLENSNVGAYSEIQWQSASSFRFSVEGDLNEQELKSITDLVNNTSDLAKLFFDGDIDKAFEQAQGLNFDKESLSGFTLQLTQVQSSYMAKAYGSVQELAQPVAGEPRNKAIAEYVQKMLNNQEDAKATLAEQEDFSSLVQEIIKQMPEVQVPDLISAINRFNQFNRNITNALKSD
ncbi:DUF5610 domain-containing protein [Alteromonas lipotrueiana]|uniref:DUF5610 domain-containing protein n=1 Tax=Alteromonas lipotrueiana TaxID=2803815 RepID=UPI001C44FD08|nr:DUF5610 domain-containing protein [Alteromonas lipotrueiana]